MLHCLYSPPCCVMNSVWADWGCAFTVGMVRSSVAAHLSLHCQFPLIQLLHCSKLWFCLASCSSYILIHLVKFLDGAYLLPNPIWALLMGPVFCRQKTWATGVAAATVYRTDPPV